MKLLVGLLFVVSLVLAQEQQTANCQSECSLRLLSRIFEKTKECSQRCQPMSQNNQECIISCIRESRDALLQEYDRCMQECEGVSQTQMQQVNQMQQTQQMQQMNQMQQMPPMPAPMPPQPMFWGWGPGFGWNYGWNSPWFGWGFVCNEACKFCHFGLFCSLMHRLRRHRPFSFRQCPHSNRDHLPIVKPTLMRILGKAKK